MEYHQAVLLKESVDGLNIKPNGVYVDVTFGGGGHSREILNRLEGGCLFAFDQDRDAAANAINDPRFILIQHNFKFITNFLRYYGYNQVDGILADLGVSSHHFNVVERGFSFRHALQGENLKTPLDMRMNSNSDFSAMNVLNEYTAEQLQEIFTKYGELKLAYFLSKIIVEKRQKVKIRTVEGFLNVIKELIPKKNENKFLAQVFQALRIEVNHEMQVLRQLLEQSSGLLKSGGRLVVISYHSLEDKMVKNLFRDGLVDGKIDTDIYGHRQLLFKPVYKKVITPSEEEVAANNRARSAKLRIGEKN